MEGGILVLSIGFTAFCVRENGPSSPVYSGLCIVRIEVIFAMLWYFLVMIITNSPNWLANSPYYYGLLVIRALEFSTP